MKQQQGAALIIVMALLAGALMLGMSGMQSALIDERLAGNYRATVIAQMAAEYGAAERIKEDSYNKYPDSSAMSCSDLRESINEKDRFSDFKKIESYNETSIIGYYHGGCLQEDGRNADLVIGQVRDMPSGNIDDYIAIAFLAIVEKESTSIPPEDDGSVNIGKSAITAGDGGVSLTGSARVSGGIITSGNVEISGGATSPDSIDAGGNIVYPDWWDDEQVENYNESVSLGPDIDDPFDIKELYKRIDQQTIALTRSPFTYQDIRVGSYPLVDATISQDGLVAYDQSYNVQDYQTIAEATGYNVSDIPNLKNDAPVIRTKNFNLTNGSLSVTGGEDVVLIVDGDLRLGGGGGKGLIFDANSTLTVIVTGNTYLGSSLQMQDLPVTENGKPKFMIYSSKKNRGPNDRNVIINGSSQVMAMIYAPYANVDISGSGGLRGAVWGNRVTVSGAGRVIGEGSFGVDQDSGAGNEESEVEWVVIE